MGDAIRRIVVSIRDRIWSIRRWLPWNAAIVAPAQPLYVLELLAYQEAYWNKRQEELTTYLKEITEEIKERTRTRCTHCNNMTAIKFKHELPRTWSTPLLRSHHDNVETEPHEHLHLYPSL